MLEERGSIDFGKKPEKIIEGKDNSKELFDKFLNELKDFANQKNIDRVVGPGSAKELAGDIQIAKDILEENGLLEKNYSDGKEILRNIETAFTPFLKKAREKGVERYADIIKEKYDELKIIAELIIECEEFRRKEFDEISGYLNEEENKKENASLRLDTSKYLKACKEKFEKRNN